MPIAENLLEWMVGRMDPAERREVLQKAVPRMLEGMSADDVAALMASMMPAIVKALKPEELAATMTRVMPMIVEGMKPDDVTAMMFSVTPQMARVAGGARLEQKKRLVSDVVPEVARVCLEAESEEAVIAAVRDTFQSMMESCFASASLEQKERLFSQLHAVLQEQESKHLKK